MQYVCTVVLHWPAGGFSLIRSTYNDIKQLVLSQCLTAMKIELGVPLEGITMSACVDLPAFIVFVQPSAKLVLTAELLLKFHCKAHLLVLVRQTR